VRLRDPEDRVWITVFENEFQDFDRLLATSSG
jgi:hypothetical protein